MRLVLMSDPHNKQGHLLLPDGDVLIVAGDLSMSGSFSETMRALAWIAGQPHPHKLVIAGKHDWAFYPERRLNGSRMPDMTGQVPDCITYLEDNETVIDGVRFYGSPWQPAFFDWAFNLERGPELAAKWAKIPDDTNVLITHGPPYGYGDRVKYKNPGEDPNVGCHDLLTRIRQLPKLKLSVFGHIHEGYGQWTHDGVTFVNASIVNAEYEPVNPAVVIDL